MQDDLCQTKSLNASHDKIGVIYGDDLGDCGDKAIDTSQNISVTVQLEDDQVSWTGEWVEVYFQNWFWSNGAPWDYVHCNLSGVEWKENNTQYYTSICSPPDKYYPGR